MQRKAEIGQAEPFGGVAAGGFHYQTDQKICRDVRAGADLHVQRTPLKFTAGQNLSGRKWLFYNKTLRQLSKWDFLLVLDFDNHLISK